MTIKVRRNYSGVDYKYSAWYENNKGEWIAVVECKHSTIRKIGDKFNLYRGTCFSEIERCVIVSIRERENTRSFINAGITPQSEYD